MAWLDVQLAGITPQSETIGSNPDRQLVSARSICGCTNSSGDSMAGESPALGPGNPMQPPALENGSPEAGARHNSLGRDFLKCRGNWML